MIVVFDNNVLCLLLHPDAAVPNDPATGKPVNQAQDRMALLVEFLREQDARIVIPTPVLSEFLTFASTEYLSEIHSTKYFEIGEFNERAAIESAVTLRKAIQSGRGKKDGLVASWQKIKIDRQIVAIAKVYGATVIYTTDAEIPVLAAASGITAVHVADLPLPASNTPLLDGIEPTALAVASSETAQPSAQSLAGASEKAPAPAPVPLLPLPAVQGPQQPGSSPTGPPLPPSTK